MKFKIAIICLFTKVFFSCAQTNDAKPNVIIVYTDDHRYTGIHALGGMPVKTPNMDRLAEDGIAFTKTYLQGAFSGATCIPSRAMLLTGRHLFSLDGIGRNIPESHTTMGEWFKKKGYNSHIVGKWHQDNASLNRSFDSGDKIMGRSAYLVDHFRMPFWDFNKNGKYTREEAYLLQFDENGKRIKRGLTDNDKRGPTGTEANGPHTSEIFAESASNYISNYKEDKPFFMYLAFHAPHDPRQAPKEYLDMYKHEDITLTPSYMPQHPFDNGDMTLRDEALAPWPRTTEVARKHLAEYYAIITHLDEQIGKVIATLKKTGQYKNTLIVFAGDSGLAVGNHGLIGKQSVYDEDGIHVPFVLSGGFINDKGKRIDAFVYTHDIFPTVCEVVNIEAPESANGKSLVPVINGEVKEVRNTTYHAYKQFQRGYRKGEYKLIEYVKAPGVNWKNGPYIAGSRVTQLFNVEKDPWETNDLSFLPEYEELLKEMRQEMKEQAANFGDGKSDQKGREVNFWDYFN